jgi:hypothetical protein
MDRAPPPRNPPGSVIFFLGFLCGAFIGGVLTYAYIMTNG